ncbi:hypothetical protein HFN60_25635 [Rhizobium leguminosarum]|nr:hypothetical protein [Rhizobium leguminosarum]NKL79867.1 hypothetical protein [Rhizobium leguminosarum bv. viciae]
MAIARALLVNPKLLICDEILSALKENMLMLFARARRRTTDRRYRHAASASAKTTTRPAHPPCYIKGQPASAARSSAAVPGRSGADTPANKSFRTFVNASPPDPFRRINP